MEEMLKKQELEFESYKKRYDAMAYTGGDIELLITAWGIFDYNLTSGEGSNTVKSLMVPQLNFENWQSGGSPPNRPRHKPTGS